MKKKEHSKYNILVLLQQFCCLSSRAGWLDNITIPFKYTQ